MRILLILLLLLPQLFCSFPVPFVLLFLVYRFSFCLFLIFKLIFLNFLFYHPPLARTPLLEEERRSLVDVRRSGGRELTTSVTSDLTSSITSAASASTLVGEAMDSSAYYSGEEGEATAFLGRSGEEEREEATFPWTMGEEEGEETCFLGKRGEVEEGRSRLLNLTHIDEIQFADSD